MKTEDFISLYTLDYNLDHVFAMRQHWAKKGYFNMNAPRKTSCFLYFCGCAGEYRTEEGRLTVPQGAVVYIPEGAVYKTTFRDFNETPVDTILVEFSLCLPGGGHFTAADRITVLKQADPFLSGLFNQVVEEQSSTVVSVAAIKAAIYQIINHISRAQRQQKILSGRLRLIEKGIACLESDLQQKKTVQELADMCFVSPNYFRRLFKEYAGMSPAEYRVSARIEYAKRLLNSGAMTTREVAREVGFEDPAYFCRVFKKYCGVSPGKYAK